MGYTKRNVNQANGVEAWVSWYVSRKEERGKKRNAERALWELRNWVDNRRQTMSKEQAKEVRETLTGIRNKEEGLYQSKWSEQIGEEVTNMFEWTPLWKLILAILTSTWIFWWYEESEDLDSVEFDWYEGGNQVSAIDLKKYPSTIDVDSLRLSAKQKNFLRNAIPLSQKVQDIYWIPWQVCLAQSINESWWGESAPDWNYFWIKHTKYSPKNTDPWGNGRLTTEEWPWWKYTVRDKFESHWTMEQSFMRYWEFISKNPRYRSAFAYKDQPLEFLKEVRRKWYATSSSYVTDVSSVWKTLKLTA